MLDVEYQDPYKNMAVDEAILIAVNRNIVPSTVRLWRNSNAVVVGRSQNVKEEVNLEACKKYGASIVRRFTGGGAVYQDRGNLNWTIVSRRYHLISKSKAIMDIFRVFSQPILESIKALGIKAEFNPPNSIFVNDKKISGMAAYVKTETILCHGTLLVSTDLSVLTNVLKTVKNKVTTLQQELGKRIPLTHVKKAIVKGFNIYGIRIERGNLSRDEISLVKKLYREKYATEEWNLRLH
jgi:lipoate-protein ligase A